MNYGISTVSPFAIDLSGFPQPWNIYDELPLSLRLRRGYITSGLKLDLIDFIKINHGKNKRFGKYTKKIIL